MYVCVCIYMYVCMYACISVIFSDHNNQFCWVHNDMYVCVCTRMSESGWKSTACMHACIYVCLYEPHTRKQLWL